MIISRLKLQKSKTVGVMLQGGKTSFRKIQFNAEAELDDNEDPKESYKKLSIYIDECLNTESVSK